MSPAAVAPAARERALLEAIESYFENRREQVESLRGRAELVLSAPAWGGASRVESAVLAERPAKLRLRGYAGPTTVFDVVSRSDRFSLYLPDRELVWRGPVGDLSEITGFPARPQDLVAALFGEPFGGIDSLTILGHDPDGVEVRGRLADGARVEGRFRRDRMVPTEFTLSRAGEEVATLRYSGYLLESVGWWPRQVSLHWPKLEARLRITYRELELNPDLPDGAFELRAPEGTTEVEIGLLPSDSDRLGSGK